MKESQNLGWGFGRDFGGESVKAGREDGGPRGSCGSGGLRRAVGEEGLSVGMGCGLDPLRCSRRDPGSLELLRIIFDL